MGIYAVELYRLLKPKNPDVRLIYVGALEDDLDIYEKLSYLRKTNRLLFRPSVIRSNYNMIIKDKKYDDYLFHYTGTDFFALKRRPGIITIHDLIQDKIFIKSNLSILKFLNALERYRKFRKTIKLAKRAKKIVSMSKVVQEEIKERTGLDSLLINRWIVEDKFKVRDKDSCKNILNLNTNFKYFLSVGNNRGNKRTDLIKVLSDSLPQNCKMLKIGYPIESVNCINLGKVEDKLYPLYFNACDGYVHMSDNEGLGLPLLEALGSEIPVICRDLKINREILGNCILPIQEKEIQSNLKSIVSNLDSKDFRESLKEEIRKRREIYNPQLALISYVRLYTETLI